jgi:AAA15 family ATPase/GTPase
VQKTSDQKILTSGRMFKSMRLKNFKGYKDSGDVPLAPLTIIIGKNNSGKSSLLQAIMALAQSTETPFKSQAFATNGPMVKLNGFYDILHGKGELAKTFEISLTLDSQQQEFRKHFFSWSPEGNEVLADRLDITFGLAPKTNEIVVKKTIFWHKSSKLIEIGANRQCSSDLFPQENWDSIRFQPWNFLPIFVFHGDGTISKSQEKSLAPLAKSVIYSTNSWRLILSGVYRVRPIRSRIPWYSGVGTSSEFGEDLIASLGSNETLDYRRGGTLGEQVNEWVSNRLQILEKLHVESVDDGGTVRSLLGDEYGGMKNINVAAMGEGVSQILPIIERSLALSSAGCLIVEQPELHLHPALQADLGDLFIEVVAKGSNQVIVETHSEHLLLRVRRRIAESSGKDGQIKPEQVSILYTRKNGSESIVEPLKLNGRGHFSDWPEGFFDEAYQEAMALAQAASKKPR